MKLLKDNRISIGALGGSLVVLMSICTAGFGQQQAQRPDDEAKIMCGLTLATTLEIVQVQVRDGYSWPVSDLTLNNFIVFEDGKEQPIAFFRQKNVPGTEESAGEYEIGYFPPTRDGEFKKVRVRFRHTRDAKDRGLRLSHYPRGYYSTFKD